MVSSSIIIYITLRIFITKIYDMLNSIFNLMHKKNFFDPTEQVQNQHKFNLS